MMIGEKWTGYAWDKAQTETLYYNGNMKFEGIPAVRVLVHTWGDGNVTGPNAGNYCLDFQANIGGYKYFYLFNHDATPEYIEAVKQQIIDLLRVAGDWGGE
jgi:hypothetical protein